MRFPVTKRRATTAVIAMFASLVATGLPSRSDATPTNEVRALYEQFAAAQNRRDLDAVRSLFLTSEKFLWVSDGMSFWGPDAVIARMAEFQKYEIWQVAPDLQDAVVVQVDTHAAYLHLPLALTLGPRTPGPDTHRFLVSMLCVETPQGWRIAALFTTAQKPR